VGTFVKERPRYLQKILNRTLSLLLGTTLCMFIT